MTKPVTQLNSLRRPRLLIRAARHGVAEYDRETTLNRLIEPTSCKSSNDVLAALLEAEEQAETNRREKGATYSITHHIELLIALMGEARHLALSGRPA